MPPVLGVIVTLQLEVVTLIVTRVHGEPLTTAVEVPVFVTATVPAGADVVPGEVSLTKEVQVMAWPTETDVGVHDTTVVVTRFVTLTVLLVPVLPL